MTLRNYIHGMRVRTLPLGAAPVITGAALAYAGRNTSVSRFWTIAVLCLCVAMLLQVGANFANDYSDGIRGTDRHRTEATERSTGPSRLVAAGIPARHVLVAAGVNALLACVAGLVVTVMTGHWWFIALGALCVLAGWCYVGGKHPYGYRGFGELAVLIFFGFVPLIGTAYALTGTASFANWYMALVLGLIAVGVLCINNLRDIETDEAAGKQTWMVLLGRSSGNLATAVILIVPMVLVLLPWCNLVFPGFTESFGSLLWFGASLLCMIACLDLLVRAISAIYRRNYRVALSVCAFASLCVALMLIFAAL